MFRWRAAHHGPIAQRSLRCLATLASFPNDSFTKSLGEYLQLKRSSGDGDKIRHANLPL